MLRARELLHTHVYVDYSTRFMQDLLPSLVHWYLRTSTRTFCTSQLLGLVQNCTRTYVQVHTLLQLGQEVPNVRRAYVATEARVEGYHWSHHAKQNQQNIAAASVGWHDDAPEEPKMMKNGSDHIEDDQLTNRLNFKTTFIFQGLMARDAETPMACMN